MPFPSRPTVLTGALALAVAGAALGCGSGGYDATAAGSTAAPAAPSNSGGYGRPTPAATTAKAGKKVHVTADPNGGLAFTRKHLTAKAGRITLLMRNPGSSGVAHGIGVEGHGVDKDGTVVSAGHTARVTVRLKRGRYTFYCPVSGHKAAGMKGTLVVR